jgi:hypothetical protein
MRQNLPTLQEVERTTNSIHRKVVPHPQAALQRALRLKGSLRDRFNDFYRV